MGGLSFGCNKAFPSVRLDFVDDWRLFARVAQGEWKISCRFLLISFYERSLISEAFASMELLSLRSILLFWLDFISLWSSRYLWLSANVVCFAPIGLDSWLRTSGFAFVTKAFGLSPELHYVRCLRRTEGLLLIGFRWKPVAYVVRSRLKAH